MKHCTLFLLSLCLTQSLTGFNFDFSNTDTYTSLPEKHLSIIIPMYKNHDWVEFCLDSIYTQNYTNYSVIIIDDASPDDTTEQVRALVHKYNKEDCTSVITNAERHGALYNIYHAVHSCPDTDIIITVDGDDKLANNLVFKKVNAVYSCTTEIWLTHGYFHEYPYGFNDWSKPIPRRIVQNNDFRSFTAPSHLRTFYAKLFKRIKKKDLLHNGEFYQMTWDQAMMFPMIEMAAERHYYFGPENLLYLYNRITPINDCKVNAQLQRDLEKVIRSKRKYRRIESLWD